MPRPYIASRNRAFLQQGGLCFWCHASMWLTDAPAFAHLHRITVKQAQRFQCTGEHLTMQRDGGTHDLGNVVAACRYCNLTRNKAQVPDPSPSGYGAWVRKLVKRGTWHPSWARHILVHGTNSTG